MTDGVPETVPQDFPIQSAENEGMPPGPDAEGIPPRAARPGRRTGTLRLGQSEGVRGNRRTFA